MLSYQLHTKIESWILQDVICYCMKERAARLTGNMAFLKPGLEGSRTSHNYYPTSFGAKKLFFGISVRKCYDVTGKKSCIR